MSCCSFDKAFVIESLHRWLACRWRDPKQVRQALIMYIYHLLRETQYDMYCTHKGGKIKYNVPKNNHHRTRLRPEASSKLLRASQIPRACDPKTSPLTSEGNCRDARPPALLSWELFATIGEDVAKIIRRWAVQISD